MLSNPLLETYMTIKINNADDQWLVARQDSTGAVSGNLFHVPFIPGSRFDNTSDMTTSKTQNPNRAAGASRRNNYKVSGGLDMDLQVCDAFEIFLKSLLAGKFDAHGQLLASNVQSTFYAEERYVNNGVVNINTYSGLDAMSITIDAKYSGDNVSMKMTAIGTASATGTAASAYTVSPLATLNPFSGQDIQNVTIAGLTGLYYSDLSLSIESKKDTQGALGQKYAIGSSADGAKTVKLTVTFYRSDFTPEASILDLPLNLSFKATIGGIGYSFTLPTARGTIPKNTQDSGSRMVQVDFMAELDPVTGTDVIVQKLPLSS